MSDDVLGIRQTTAVDSLLVFKCYNGFPSCGDGLPSSPLGRAYEYVRECMCVWCVCTRVSAIRDY